MRPRHDITHPEADAAETIHFLRHSNDQWQATAERVARQRDAAAAEVEVARILVSTIEAILDARDITEKEALESIGREIDLARRTRYC